MITATATEMQNNFGRYLNLVMSGQEVIVTKNGREVGCFIPKDAVQSVTAERVHADYIITRNVRDFAKSKVVAFTPSELIVRI